MIRIDENTYIDDTLVTCAEYQLFIDEMREQGKYYQPDHWTSYQFPVGQAHAPIMGIRFNDAKAFCEWITKREAGGWSFRLPTSYEAKYFPLTNPTRAPLGYWIAGLSTEAEFVWVGSTPFHPRNINIGGALDFDFALALAIENTLDRARTIDLDSALDIESTLDRARTNNRALDLARAIDRTVDFGHYRPSDRDRILDRTLDRTSDFASALDFARTRVLDRASILTNIVNYDRTIDLSRAREIDINLNLYIDIYTLQERIAGRSPAFEGIRLVKERKP